MSEHKSKRSVSRLLGQDMNFQGAPLECRFAYVFIDRKKQGQQQKDGSKSKDCYSITVMVPKRGDAATCPNYRALSDHCMEAAIAAWGQWPVGGNWPIKDGDIITIPKVAPGQPAPTQEQIDAKNAWHKGFWYVECTNMLDPGPRACIAQNGSFVEVPARLINGQEMYKSGDWGFVSLSAFTYHKEDKNSFGVKFGFEGVLFTRQDERIGAQSGPRSAEQMFGNVHIPQSAAQAGPPMSQQPAGPPVVPMSPQPAGPPVAPMTASAQYAPQLPQQSQFTVSTAPQPGGLPPIPQR